MNHCKFVVVLAFSLVCLSLVVWAQPQYHDHDWLVQQMAKQKGYDWKSSPWTGDEKPYKSIRQSIDKMIAQGNNPRDLELRYRKPADKDFYNPQTQFRWAYAAYRAMKADPKAEYAYNGELLYRTIRAMDGTLKAHTYEWTRLRFLLGILDSSTKGFIPVGDRLLKYDPKDIEVKYQFLTVLGFSRDVKNIKRAVAIAQNMLREHPKSARYHSSLAGAYVNLWRAGGSVESGDQAIAEYKTYLQLAPLTEPFRKDAEFWIKAIQTHRDEKGRFSYKKAQ